MAGVVAALTAEARTLGSRNRYRDSPAALRDGTLVAVSGVGCDAAASAALALVDAGATALISWGLAGGLDPALSPGTICVPSVIVAGDGTTFSTDIHWREIVTAAISGRRTVAFGNLLTSAEPIDAIADKAAAFRDTGAVAVDMESSAVAAVAATYQLPFIAVRVIVDTALDAIPASVLAASCGGQVRLSRLLAGLLRSPGEIAPLVRLARRYRVARLALVSVARTGALAPLAYSSTSPSRIA